MIKEATLIMLFGVGLIGIVYGQSTVNERLTIEINIISGASGHGCEDTVRGCFIPKYAKVDVGQKVIFKNTDNTIHTFTAGVASKGPSRIFDSSLIAANYSFEWIPSVTGVFPYHCSIHPWMAGVITVEGTQKNDNTLKVIFIDLETKGESILVLYPNGKNMLIDGGMPGSYSKLESVLKKYNVYNIDMLVGTHADQDHIGGLNRLLDDVDFNVKKVIVSGVLGETNTYQSFLGKAEENGIVPEIVYDSYDIKLSNLVSTEIISPSPNGLRSAQDATLQNTNSLVIWMEYNDISFLFNSDASFLTEKYIIENHPVNIDIMTSPHHGSKYSSTERFLKMASPELIIISADENNQYGHPDKDTTMRYDKKRIAYYQTGINGTMVVKTDGLRCSLLFESGAEQPCYNRVKMVLDYIEPDVPICKSRNAHEYNDDCFGAFHVIASGYYDYKTGVVRTVIDPYGSNSSNSRDIWIVDDWVINIQKWYDKKMITPDIYDNALQYLIDEGIAKYQKI